MEFGKSDVATQVSSDDPLPVLLSDSGSSFLVSVASADTLESIVAELTKINFHLNLITGGDE